MFKDARDDNEVRFAATIILTRLARTPSAQPPRRMPPTLPARLADQSEPRTPHHRRPITAAAQPRYCHSAAVAHPLRSPLVLLNRSIYVTHGRDVRVRENSRESHSSDSQSIPLPLTRALPHTFSRFLFFFFFSALV